MIVEAKSRITPQIALDVLTRLKSKSSQGVPLVYSPVVSERVQALCREHDVGFLDGAGNCRIAAPGLFVERRGVGTTRQERPSIDPFAPKASRIVRVLLSAPGRGWQVQELARCEGLEVSLGLASKVKQTLVEQGFAVQRDRLLYVRNPHDLLDAWAEGYAPGATPMPLYVPGGPQEAESAVARWCSSNGLRYGLTQFSGAWRAAPAVRYQRSTLYTDPVDDDAWESLAELGQARRVETGANVVLWQTYDPAVFFGDRLLGDPPLRTVSAIQLYLDLKQLRGRGEEAAKAIFETEIAPAFADAKAGNATEG